MTDRPAHSAQCSWHCDQYDSECDCGAARQSTQSWAEREVAAAEEALERARANLARARNRASDLRLAKAPE